MNIQKILKIIESSRIERMLPTLMIVLLSVAITTNFDAGIIVLGISIILIYSAAGIQNAIEDNDFLLPRYSKKIMIIPIVLALILSTYNPLIFIASSLSIFLGFFYNKISRKFILMDTAILSLTHYTIPLITSLLILGAPALSSLKISGVALLFFFLASPIKNLKDIRLDKYRKYKTLPMIPRGEPLTYAMFILSFITIMIIFIFLKSPVSMLIIYSLYAIIIILLKTKKINTALQSARLTFIAIIFLIILEITSNNQIIYLGIDAMLLYSIIAMGGKIKWKK